MKKVKVFVALSLLFSVISPVVSVATEAKATPIKVAVEETKAKLELKDILVKINTTWTPEMNFVSLTNEKGEAIKWQDIEEKMVVDNKVDVTKLGETKITYTINGLKETAKVTVVEKLPEIMLNKIQGKDVEITQNTPFSVEMAFDYAINTEEKALSWTDVKDIIKVDSKVDVTTVGTYPVTFTYNKLVASVNVKVVPPLPVVQRVNVQEYTLELGHLWSPEMNFQSITMSDGSQLTWENVKDKLLVEGKVDTMTPGVYTIKYTYSGLSAEAKVTVNPLEKLTIEDLQLQEITTYVGKTWTPKNNFVQVLMSDGTILNWQDVERDMKIVGDVDTKKPGTYHVTYYYGDIQRTTSVKVESLEVVSVQKVVVTNATLPRGAEWKAQDNFSHVLMSDGSQLEWKDVEKEISINGKVNTNAPDIYKVTYTYGDISSIATITVKDLEVIKVQEVSVKDTTLPTNQPWQAKDNFNYVTMSDGSKLDWDAVKNDIKVTGKVDTTKPSTHKVTYEYGDKKAVATITVKDLEVVKVQEIKLKEVNVPTGMTWKAQDSFSYVLLTSGTKLEWKDVEKEIKVTGEVKTNIPGSYKVTYTYQDQKATTTVTVKDMEVTKVQQIMVKNSTIAVGSKWQAKDNFDSVMMTDGTKLDWTTAQKDILVTGETTNKLVDTSKVGVYKVKYTYGGQSATATITVTTANKKLVQAGEKENQLIFVAGIWFILVAAALYVNRKRKSQL